MAFHIQVVCLCILDTLRLLGGFAVCLINWRSFNEQFFAPLIATRMLWEPLHIYLLIFCFTCFWIIYGPILITIEMSITTTSYARIEGMRQYFARSIEIIAITMILSAIKWEVYKKQILQQSLRTQTSIFMLKWKTTKNNK